MQRVLGTVNLHAHPLPVNLFFLVHRHLESHVAVQPFPLPPLLPLTLLFFSRSRPLPRPSSFFSGLVRVLFRPERDVGSVDEDMSDENGWQEG